ncbi:GntP family permease [Leadbettera azotonutricia]|uniref:Gluconate transporter n=1 Tax=Leadbettera azotonutricia (strain ATCC BAA-888 / DSM 13862 / ZAS-9) TaxID=545695 RepID=F5Y825_LEAAZ|nr:GntP family permease [Leadbettera azotonutricia]AEF82928.1 gluconate transporter [Leadbettera azotonutricia ZAS-9]
MYQVVLLILSVVLLLVLISKLRLHAFLALLLVSLLLGIAAGMPLTEVATQVAAGFGGTMQNIGIVIICGVIIGQILENTGGAQKIAASILKLVGMKKATLATAISGGVVSIPTFCDAGFVILNPVIRALSRSGNIPYMCLVTALMTGLLTTHSLVPPTPGPIAAAGILGADVGIVMIYGLIISIPVIGGTYLWCNSKFLKKKYPELAPIDAVNEEQNEKFKEIVAHAPSTFMSYMPIVVPIILIVIRSFVMQYAQKGPFWYDLVVFIGTPYIALLIGAFAAFLLPTKITEDVSDGWISKAISGAAEILLITGIAGCFGRILQTIGVGTIMADAIAGLSLPSIVLPFAISAIVLIAQGSATVALTTTAAIILPLLGSLNISPELAVIAIAGGSFCGVFPQGSYFWCVTKLAGYDIKKGYVAVTATTFIMGAIAFVSILILSFIVH